MSNGPSFNPYVSTLLFGCPSHCENLPNLFKSTQNNEPLGKLDAIENVVRKRWFTNRYHYTNGKPFMFANSFRALGNQHGELVRTACLEGSVLNNATCHNARAAFLGVCLAPRSRTTPRVLGIYNRDAPNGGFARKGV